MPDPNITKSSDLVVPEVLADAVAAGFAGMAVLAGSGAAVVNDTLPGNMRAGTKVIVPYFGSIGELEELDEGEALTPVKLTQTGEEAIVQRAGKSFSPTELAKLAGAGDVTEEATRQILEAVQRHVDKKLIEAAATTPLVHDITGKAEKTISWDAVIDAKTQWGDEQDDIVLMVVHSRIWADLCKLKDSGGKPLAMAVNDGTIDRFAGIPVLKSDRLPVSGGNYTSLILKRGSVVWWHAIAPRIRTGEDVDRDMDKLAVNVYGVTHMYKRMPGLTKPGVVKLITKAAT